MKRGRTIAAVALTSSCRSKGERTFLDWHSTIPNQVRGERRNNRSNRREKRVEVEASGRRPTADDADDADTAMMRSHTISVVQSPGGNDNGIVEEGGRPVNAYCGLS